MMIKKPMDDEYMKQACIYNERYVRCDEYEWEIVTQKIQNDER